MVMVLGVKKGKTRGLDAVGGSGVGKISHLSESMLHICVANM